MKHTLTLLICLLICTSFVFAQDGTLDSTFGNGGIVTTAIGTNDEVGYGIAIQSDGKIVVAGYSTIGSYNEFAVVRYNIDGSLDSLFDEDGIATTNIGTYDEIGNSVTIQSDGKIIVAGLATNSNGKSDFAVVRLNTDGSLDTSFDVDGKATTSIGTSDGIGYSVATQPDGKIVVAGTSINNGISDFAIIRFNSDGSLDSSFNVDGIAITNFAPYGSIGYSVAIQLDGKIVVAGDTQYGSYNEFAVVRYNTDGSLDASFDEDGKVITTVGNYTNRGKSIAIQSDGKIVVAGFSDSGNYHFAVVRYNSDGNLDTSFDEDGKTVTLTESNEYPYSIAIQSDGKIVVAGHFSSGGHAVFGVVRYNTNGSLDGSFEGGGKTTTSIGAYGSGGYSVAIQSDGKIIVAGRTLNASGYDIALVRYNNPSLSLSLPVELTSFSASSTSDNIQLNWKTATESNNVGWEVEEKQNPLNPPLKNGEKDGGWRKIGFVSGKGTTTEAQTYSFTLPITHNSSQSFFRLKQIDADGKFVYSNELSVNLVPETYSLSQNYPNPFNPKTIISYALPKSGKVVLKIYDVLGKEISVLENGFKESGRYSVNFDGSSLSSGMYFYKLESGGFSQVKKFQLVK